MRFWIRQASLTLGSSRYSFDNLNFNFTVNFEDRPKMSTAQLEVYNLSPSTRAGMSKGQTVILSAGYKGDVGCIFVGTIADFSHKDNGLDIVTKVTAADSMEQWLGVSINKTYAGPITAKDILDDLLNIFGVEIGMVKLAVNKTYPRGKVCRGKMKDVLTEIACSDCVSRLVIRTGQIIINPPGEGIHSGLLLTPATGLLVDSETSEGQDTTTKTKAATKATRSQQNEADTSNKRRCLLNYRIGCADVVNIRDSKTNGSFMVVSGSHVGSRDAEWATKMEVKPA